LAAPDLVFESAEPVFNDIDEPVLRPFTFGAAWIDTPPPGPVNNRPSDLCMSEPLESKARLYQGRAVPAAEMPAVEPPRHYDFDLALPAAAPTRLTGVNVNNPAANLLESFAVLGFDADQLLADSLDVGDINGDRFHDYLLNGPDVSYLVLGPVKLDDVRSILDQPMIVLDTATLGVPLSRGGDVDGDGINDLAFVTSRSDCSGGDCILVTVVNVLFGNANLPNFINFAFLNASNSSAVQFRNQLFAPVGNSVHLMNFNGDVNPVTGLPFADLLVMTSDETEPPALTTGFVISGFDIRIRGTTICAGETGILCNNSLWRIHTDAAYFDDAFV
jgi:hypothetical protein